MVEIFGIIVLIVAVLVSIWNPYRTDAEVQVKIDEWQRSEKLRENMGLKPDHSRQALSRLMNWGP